MKKILATVFILAGTFIYVNAQAVECDYGVKLADTCPEGMTFIGCCDGAKLIWCGNKEGDTGPLCGINCADNITPEAQVCGWSADAGFYDCGGSGANPADPGSINCAWTCTPSCSDKDCGDDGCLGTCGTCGEGKFCNEEGKCQDCSCQGKVCGADECGNPCGGPCEAGKGCLNGQCVPIPDHCIEKETKGCPGCPCETCTCQEDPWCCPDSPDGNWDSWCIMECVELCEGDPCPCAGDCEGKECGGDGCGGTCGTCPANSFCDNDGKCQVCTCEGKDCGEDGCGNKCGPLDGACPAGKVCDVNGKCVEDPCKGITYEGCCQGTILKYCDDGTLQTFDCGDKGCGWADIFYDCGGSGEDPSGQNPINCPECTPECTGKECGPDGCGGTCGTCGPGMVCGSDGKCGGGYPNVCLGEEQPSSPTCTATTTYEGCCDAQNRVVWCDGGQLYCLDCTELEATCGWDNQKQFYLCGGSDTPPPEFPMECMTTCTPNCNGAECGDGGCPDMPDACGKCEDGKVCVDGKCTSCTPNCTGKQCGDDGCGGSCGTCPNGKVCVEGLCEEPCTPNCEGKECGSDGCQGVCGTCAAGKTCNAEGKCVDVCVPNCKDKECGDDGCGGSCGTCPSGKKCEAGICVTTVDGPVVQDVPVTDKPGTDVVVVIDSGTDGTGGGGDSSGCNTGVGGQALPFALLLSSLGLALLRRR